MGCGSIDQTGFYTAPNATPSSGSIQVVAISQDDETQSGTASVTISSAANLVALLPASVYAGSSSGFTLVVSGGGFVPSSLGPGSILLIAGTPRVTTCSSSAQCTAPVSAVDVAVPGNVTVQIQNPNNAKSNIVSLVVVAPSALIRRHTLS